MYVLPTSLSLSLSPSLPSSPSLFPSRYDKKDTTKLQLVDLQIIGAMGPPGGGSNPSTPRFLRHFNVSSITEFSDETLSRIFSNIVSFQLKVS